MLSSKYCHAPTLQPKRLQNCMGSPVFSAVPSPDPSRMKSGHAKALKQPAITDLFALARELHRCSEAQEPESKSTFKPLNRVLRVQAGQAKCQSTSQLEAKFGIGEDNSQLVVSVTNVWTGDQAWWNADRTKKPQTFVTEAQPLPDSTDGGKKCDFCQWEEFTASDTFGRIENESCVTASNLFKYAFPCHGLVLFKHHDPLSFSEAQVRDLLAAAAGWFQAAHETHSRAAWPLFLWNCLPRAGASQFHGHAQTLLTEEPTPAAADWQQAAKAFAEREGSQLVDAMREAYRCAGLCREILLNSGEHAWCFASLTPTKDMEILVFGEKLTCPAFAKLLHRAARALIDQLSVTSFNVAILNISLCTGTQKGPVMARMVSRGPLGKPASDFGALEVFGRASIGHTDPYAVTHALDLELQK